MSNLLNFIEDDIYSKEIDKETRLRIQLAIYAYAYEYDNNALVSDGEFDAMCKKVNLSINTRRPIMDIFFKKKFNPSTGMWIRDHPEIGRIKHLYEKHYKDR